MNWIIRDGQIVNVDGDGIRIQDPRGNILISGMTITGAKGSGIVIGGGSPPTSNAPNAVPLDQVLDLIESRLHELRDEDQQRAHQVLEQARATPTTLVVRRSLKVIYDLAVNVAGSTIASILQRMM